jgi:hypothetical protein
MSELISTKPIYVYYNLPFWDGFIADDWKYFFNDFPNVIFTNDYTIANIIVDNRLNNFKHKIAENQIYIHTTGESSTEYVNVPDIIIGNSDISTEKTINIWHPYMAQIMYIPRFINPSRERASPLIDIILQRPASEKIPKKTRFGIFLVSNIKAVFRIKFYDLLSKIYKIDSPGIVRNNMHSEISTYSHDDSRLVSDLQKYKFMICFENTQRDGYMTEKLLNAYAGGTIPIYSGAKSEYFDRVINRRAIVYLPEFTEECIEVAINEIKHLNTNPAAYEAKWREPLFHDNCVPYIFTREYIQSEVKTLCTNLLKLK